MATTIRLTRMGRKKRPFYRMVVLDSRKRRDGAYLANLGYYNPFVDPHEVDIHHGDIISWLGKGATMSGTARSLLRAEGVLYRWSLIKAGLGADEVDAKVDEWRQASEERQAKMQEAAVAKKAAAARELAEKAKAEAEAEAEAKAKAKAEEEAKAKAKAEAEAAEAAAAAEKAEAEAESAEASDEAAAAAADETPAQEAAAEEPAAEAATEEEEPKKDAGREGES